MSESQTLPDVASLTFEQALEQLEKIVSRLESGNVSLEESIELYERGESLKDRCQKLLARAEARIEKITLGANGQPTGVEPLDAEG